MAVRGDDDAGRYRIHLIAQDGFDAARSVLEPVHAVTVEPGLYEEGVDGVRLADRIVLTENGYENLTDYPRDHRVG